MRRFAMIALSLSLVLGLTATNRMFAQDTAKKDEPAKAEAPKAEPAKTEPAKAETKPTPTTPAESAPVPIPPEVEKKLEAARRAVAEAIVAAQDAGLVQTTIDPPPILDILVTGRATDEQALKARTGVSPEVFGAWFSGYGKDQKVNPQSDVRIVPPSAGLKELYDQRANLLSRHIKAVRDAKGGDKPKDEATKKAEEPAKKQDEPAKKQDEPAKK